MSPEIQQRLSFDQVINEISKIAEDEGSRDQFKALKLLAAQQAGSTFLPPPLEEEEVVERTVRIMKSVGMNLVQRSYQRAFKSAKASLWQVPPLKDTEVPEELVEKAKNIVNLKRLYRTFPEIKPKGGVPAGYPMGRGIAIQQEWCRRRALQMFRDKERAIVEMNAAESKQADHDIRDQNPVPEEAGNPAVAEASPPEAEGTQAP